MTLPTFRGRPIRIDAVQVWGSNEPLSLTVHTDADETFTTTTREDIRQVVERLGMAGTQAAQAITDMMEGVVPAIGTPTEGPVLDDKDKEVISQLLQGKPPPRNGMSRFTRDTMRQYGAIITRETHDSQFRPWWGVYTASGGYHLLTRSHADSPYLISLDTPALITTHSVSQMREDVYAIEEELGDKVTAPLLPVGFTALTRGVMDPLPAVERLNVRASIKLVHRQGSECVFTLDYEDGTRYYLSAYDNQEKPPLYFLCALPGPVKTVDEAREALKPGSVKAAEEAGIEVRRQGDLFAVKSTLTDENIKAAGGVIVHLPTPVANASAAEREQLSLYGTAHTADKVAHLPDGRALAFGHFHHLPWIIGDLRGPDHKARELDAGWWWVTKNTVPISGRARQRQRW